LTTARALAAVALCAACAPQVDIVAVQSDSGADAPGGPNADAPNDGPAETAADVPPPPPPACDPLAASSVYFIDAMLVLWRFSPMTSAVTPLGVPECAQTMALTQVGGMAVSPDGKLWVVDVSGALIVIDPTVSPPSCKMQPFKLAPVNGPVALAFLPPPPMAMAPLYIVENGNLLVVNPQSFVQWPIGPVSDTGWLGLSGVFDGRLYAIGAGMSANQVILSKLDPGDGSVSNTTMVTLPSMLPLSGGAYWGGLFYLFEQEMVFSYDLTTGQLLPVMVPTKGPVTAVASAPCPPAP
jgi:hypothetical protein